MRAETEFMQHLVEQNSGVVARKRSPAAISTVHAGRQTHNQEACVRVTEGLNRSTVVAWVTFLNVIQERRKPWASPALQVKYSLVHSSAILVQRIHSIVQVQKKQSRLPLQ